MDREGDFRVWAVARRGQLRRTAFLLSGDWHLADDMVQDAMARVFAVWDKVCAQGSPDAYVRKIMVNLLIDERRRPWRTRETSIEFVAEPRFEGPSADAGGHDLIAALGAIPPRQRAVLVLRYFEDRSVDDVAAILNCTSGTVKSQTSKGLSNLRSVLADHDVNAYATNAKDPA